MVQGVGLKLCREGSSAAAASYVIVDFGDRLHREEFAWLASVFFFRSQL